MAKDFFFALSKEISIQKAAPVLPAPAALVHPGTSYGIPNKRPTGSSPTEGNNGTRQNLPIFIINKNRLKQLALYMPLFYSAAHRLKRETKNQTNL